MNRAKKKQFKKMLAGILATVMALEIGMAGNGNTARAVEAEHDYIIVFNNTKDCQTLSEKAQHLDISSEGRELLENAGIAMAEMTESEAEKLKQEKNVVSVEKDDQVSASTSEKEEADAINEVAESQWNKKAVHADKKMTASETEGSQKEVKVAVLDSGVAVTEDLEIAGRVNLVDEEGLSYLCEDMTGHGTAVASVIAAKDNGMGATGMDENIHVYSVKVLDNNNRAPVSRIIAGIQWCIDNEIDIVNMSFGMKRDSAALQAMIREAEQKGILLVAAAGNQGNGEDTVEYPAAYPEVLAVGSVTNEMTRAGSSARGEEVELVAPGENIPVTSFFGGTTIESGTSYAAPHVSAIAAMLWKDCPSWDAGKIRAWMDAGARELEDSDCGYGLIDYAYCREIQDVFDANYVPQGKKEEILPLPQANETALQEYQMPEIAALWNADGHNKLITTSLNGTASWQAAYSSDKINVLKGVSYFADTGSGSSGGVTVVLSDVDSLHACQSTNYIATVCYLYDLAMQQKNNPTKAITTIMEDYTGYHGLNSDMTELRKLKKAVNITCKASLATANYSGTSAEINGKNRSLRILGLALHVAGDAYSHKAIVFNNTEVIGKIKASNYFTGNEALIESKIKNSYLTMSGLCTYATNEKNAHRDFADNPSFCPRRYQYGAQNVVLTLLKQFYNKSASFDIKSFYNYGDNKNNISQYRLATFAAQANGGTAPGGLNWSAYSKG